MTIKDRIEATVISLEYELDNDAPIQNIIELEEILDILIKQLKGMK